MGVCTQGTRHTERVCVGVRIGVCVCVGVGVCVLNIYVQKYRNLFDYLIDLNLDLDFFFFLLRFQFKFLISI